MTALRKILTGLAVAAVTVGLANADTIISYTATAGPLPTDLIDTALTVGNAWNPGATGDTIASNQGITMAQLSAADTDYTLNWYDISITTSISGIFSVTNAPGAGTRATGHVTEDSYTKTATLRRRSAVFWSHL